MTLFTTMSSGHGRDSLRYRETVLRFPAFLGLNGVLSMAPGLPIFLEVTMVGNDGCAAWSYDRCMRRVMFAHLVECYCREKSDDGTIGYMHMALSVASRFAIMAN